MSTNVPTDHHLDGMLCRVPAVCLLNELLHRVERDDERIAAISVAELRRRCEDLDAAIARHPAGRNT
jgi:hypothetical protein